MRAMRCLLKTQNLPVSRFPFILLIQTTICFHTFPDCDFARPQAGGTGRNDADGGDDEPATAMPYIHQQANTHWEQISLSGDTPSL